MYKDEEQAARVLHRALDLGITYVDSAYAYGNGESETRIGKFLGERRKNIFLADKIPDRDYDGFMRRFEASLKRLRTDHVDLLHIHALLEADDLEKVDKGAIKALYAAREQKMTRFIGISCHQNGEVLKTAIERYDLDCTQMALNASRNGRFEELALPAANKKKLGIIAMKVTAQEKLVGEGTGRAPIESLMRYSLSLPVTACVIGMPHPEHLEQNVQIARGFKPLSSDEKEHVYRQVASSQAAINCFFCNHIDC